MASERRSLANNGEIEQLPELQIQHVQLISSPSPLHRWWPPVVRTSTRNLSIPNELIYGANPRSTFISYYPPWTTCKNGRMRPPSAGLYSKRVPQQRLCCKGYHNSLIP